LTPAAKLSSIFVPVEHHNDIPRRVLRGADPQ
jgi:hypothetical protein